MQIKEIRRAKGNPCWEFVRWEYDSAKGRSVSVSLGRMDQSWTSVPKPLLDKMTVAERETVAEWWRVTLDGRERAELRRAPWSLHSYAVPRLLRALELGEIAQDEAARVWASLDQAAAALRKAGLPRPPKSSQAAPVAPGGEVLPLLAAAAQAIAAAEEEPPAEA